MNRDARKRPWFQIHLSTAVLIMLLAGAIMWANFRAKKIEVENATVHRVSEMKGTDFGNGPAIAIFVEKKSVLRTQYGFPFPCYTEIGPPIVEDSENYKVITVDPEPKFNLQNLIINVSAAVTLLFGTWQFSERWILRGEAKAHG